MSAALGFDAVLCLGLIWLAWQLVLSREAFRATVLFMTFGLLMAVCWARLGAPNLALAEAAIGAGVTGALLLNACKAAYRLEQAREGHAFAPAYKAGAALFCGALAAGLAWLMLPLPGGGGPTAEAVVAAQADHFVSNAVTTVLLDFRAYDTLLEMVVLLLALLGARALSHQRELPDLYPPRGADTPMVRPLLAAITPLMLLTGLYLFWAGSHAPGGAFQAGALLAGLGVMYRLTARIQPTQRAGPVLRALLVAGVALFSLFACVALLWADVPLAYPDDTAVAYALVLVIEFALMVSIALTLVLTFSASPGIAATGFERGGRRT